MDKSPRIHKCPVVLDPDAADAVIDARSKLESKTEALLKTFIDRVAIAQARQPGDDPQAVAEALYQDDEADLAALRAEVDTAEKALTGATTWYTFRPLGWKAWRALKAAHSSKNKDEEFDVDSIAPTLLKEASLDPKLSAGDVEDILESDQWAESEVWMLISTAVAAQR